MKIARCRIDIRQSLASCRSEEHEITQGCGSSLLIDSLHVDVEISILVAQAFVLDVLKALIAGE